MLVPSALPQQGMVLGPHTPTGVSMTAAPNQFYVQYAGVAAGIRETANPAVVDTRYNSVARCALPEGDQSLPLGDHLLLATVGKN